VYLGLTLPAIVVGMAVVWSHFDAPPEAWVLKLTNNPDKFFLWGTTTNFTYTFTYDPHAADEWRFEIGASLNAVPRSAAPVFLDSKQGQ
jgi:hypothetical protein